MSSNNQNTQSSSSGREHVLLLPYMAEGHLIPFMTLARLLEQRTPPAVTVTVTVVSTPLNIQRLKSSRPLNTSIHFQELPFNSADHGLPPNSENTNSLPRHLILSFMKATQSLQPSFHQLVSSMCHQGCPPVCIISDGLMSWSVETAKKFGIFHTIFNTSGAFASVVVTSVWPLLPHRQTEAEEFYLPDFTSIKLHRNQLPEVSKNADGTDPLSVLTQKYIALSGQSDGSLINTVEEMESKALEHLRGNGRRMVWAIGPLLPPRPPPVTTASTASSALSCTDWLNQHPQDSVLYISFGSENSIDLPQMMELAKGLEVCGKHFIWVIRPPIGFDMNEEFRPEWLPEGFEDRITERKQGLLAKKWATQVEILAHKSTAAFLSHCGWNSVLESLSCGVPIIGWPLFGDQLYNSKLLEEELGVGVELGRGSKAEISWVDVARLIGVVMDGESEKGVEMRKKANRIEEVMKAAVREGEICKGSSIQAIESFIQKALTRKKTF